jgi:spermidine synthase
MLYSLLICFALSGFSTALYAVAAIREFSLAFGSTPLALCVGLTATLAAIAAGSFRPVHLTTRRLYLALAVLAPLSFACLTVKWLAPFALAYLLFVGLEVFAMRTQPSPARIAGFVFAARLLGLAVGVFVGGFVILPFLGMWAAILISSIIYLIAAATAKDTTSSEPARAPLLLVGAPAVTAITAMWGFTLLQYAFLWTRWLAPAVGTSVFSYALITSVICIWLGAGFALSGWLAPKARYPGLALALTSTAAAASALGVAYAVPQLPEWFVSMFVGLGPAHAPFLAGQAALIAMVAFPAVLLAAIFPLLLRAPLKIDGAALSTQWTIAIAGALAGGVVGGILLIPLVGLRGALMIAISINIAIAALSAALLTEWTARQRLVVLAATASLAVAAFFSIPNRDPYIFTSAVYANADTISERGLHTHFRIERQLPIEYFKESYMSTVAASRAGSTRFVFEDGQLEQTSVPQVLTFEFPFALGRPVHDAFVAGLGSGTIPQALTALGADRIDVAEAEPAMIAAAPREILSNPRIQIRTSDPRAALSGSPKSRYDLIVVDTSAPWNLRQAKMTTREFYAVARACLRNDGVFAQAMPIHRLDLQALQSLLATFTAAFPQVLILSSGKNATELILFGSETPLRIDWNALVRTQSTGGISPGVMLSRILLGSTEARGFATGAPLNSDNNGRVEFASLWNLYADHSPGNGPRLIAHATDPWQYVNGAPSDRRQTIVEMIYSALVTGDLQRGMKYTADLRNLGDVYGADRLTGDLLYSLDQRDAAVEAWKRCLAANPNDQGIKQRLVGYYSLLRPNQRPADYQNWLEPPK